MVVVGTSVVVGSSVVAGASVVVGATVGIVVVATVGSAVPPARTVGVAGTGGWTPSPRRAEHTSPLERHAASSAIDSRTTNVLTGHQPPPATVPAGGGPAVAPRGRRQAASGPSKRARP